ncbi:hypothetical protein GH714_038539 [Hevea brasiliensis]|uniref:Peptidase A2 domain-containing protein n=1 Tax=Hevea brasiliensis TaxID=3981 RepID=A0A6A6N9R1_HEVBR|nr:hypothetical protein GH714_038539 [Hevea brasiliensis]
MEELCEELHGALDSAVDKLASEGESLRLSHLNNYAALRDENRSLWEKVDRVVKENTHLRGELDKVLGKLKEVEQQVSLVAMAVIQGGGANTLGLPWLPSRVEVLKPNSFKGSRDAKEIDNFLWSLEQYFRALGIADDARKIDHAPFVQAKPKEAIKEKMGRLFVQASLGGQEVRALVDTGASDNFLKLQEAQRLGIRFTPERGWLKAINSNPSPIHGVAHDVPVKLGEWHDNLDFSIVSMDDYACVLVWISWIRGKVGNATLSAMQIAKGIRRDEPTYLVALRHNEEPPKPILPREIEVVLDEFHDIMPQELPKRLPPKREVDHHIKPLSL